jgi:hypothetical protein
MDMKWKRKRPARYPSGNAQKWVPEPRKLSPEDKKKQDRFAFPGPLEGMNKNVS